MARWHTERERRWIRDRRVIENAWQDRVEKGAAAHVERLKAIIDEAKKKPCTDCGKEFEPHVMDFDHLQPATKKFNISGYKSLLPSEDTLRAELAKCELVCSNCHRERTHRRAREREHRRWEKDRAKAQ